MRLLQVLSEAAKNSNKILGTTRKESKSMNWHVYKIIINLHLGDYMIPGVIQKLMTIIAMKLGYL